MASDQKCEMEHEKVSNEKCKTEGEMMSEMVSAQKNQSPVSVMVRQTK